jgi:hypothetical protein
MNRNIGFHLFGQSNAAGNVSPTEIDAALKSKLLNCSILNLENKKAEVLQAGVNSFGVPAEYYDFNKSNGAIGLRYGVEVELAKFLRDYYNASIDVFKYTWPGSGLLVSSNGGKWDYSSGNIMPKVIAELVNYKAALKIVKHDDFVVWIQGETDISSSVAYKAALKSWIDAYRNDIGYDIPLIVVTQSSQQVYLTASDIVTFRAMQLTLGSTVYNNSEGTFLTQSGYISNCYVLDQNENCQNESGTLIHYSKAGITNISNGIFQIVKNKIIY